MKQILIPSLALALTLGASAACGDSFLAKGDKWILSGDSITSTDTYRQILQLAIEHYHPDSGIVIGNRGVWGQKLSEEKRLEKNETPQIVSIMIAMNSFIHHEYGTVTDFSKTIHDHIEGLRARIREYKAKGAQVLLMTPTLVDEREGGFFVTYNSRPGLVEVGAAIRKLANEEGCFLIPVAEDVEAYKNLMGPRETFIPDGVHPYGYGQYIIANAFISRLDFAGKLGAGRHLTEKPNAAPIEFKCETRFLEDAAEPLVFSLSGAEGTPPPTSNGIKGKIRWSVWCDSLRVMTDNDCAGHCLARGEGVLTGEAKWQLPVAADTLNLKVGERARVFIDITPEDGISRLYCVDLARCPVVQMKNGVAQGKIETEKVRREGATVCTWEVREDGPDLWLSGFTTADEPSRKTYGPWANVFNMNGAQVLFDFRPTERFAGVNPDRDAPMVLFSVLEDPQFSVMPFVWMGRRYQSALFASAEKKAGGYDWRIGFRGNVTDCEAFDIRKLDYFGMHLIIADTEGDKCLRYADMDYSPLDNPERRMNQMTIFDRKGRFKGSEVTTVNFFSFSNGLK